MHSKSFTVDNQITCVGGRNVGDEYFANREQGIFADVDALCVGAVVQEVSECFDAFWNFPAAVEIDCIVKEDPKQYAASGATDFTRSVSGPSATDYLSRAAGSVLLERARAGRIEFEWVPVELVSDRPAKVLGQSRQGDLMASVLRGLIGKGIARRFGLFRADLIRCQGLCANGPQRGRCARPDQFLCFDRCRYGSCRICKASAFSREVGGASV